MSSNNRRLGDGLSLSSSLSTHALRHSTTISSISGDIIVSLQRTKLWQIAHRPTSE